MKSQIQRLDACVVILIVTVAILAGCGTGQSNISTTLSESQHGRGPLDIPSTIVRIFDSCCGPILWDQ